MAFTKKTVRDIDVDGKRVLVRVDFNVPIKDGVVGDTTRIKAALPTINYLVEHNARVILMSHLGRPEGTGFQPELSLEPVAKKLAELSGLDVAFVADTYGEKAAEAVAAVEPGTDKELPIGERGELCISGPTTMKGYYNKPDETDIILRRHPDGDNHCHNFVGGV